MLIMGLIKLICGRIIPALILLIAVFIGWVQTYKPAYGLFFAFIMPIMEGYAPPGGVSSRET